MSKNVYYSEVDFNSVQLKIESFLSSKKSLSTHLSDFLRYNDITKFRVLNRTKLCLKCIQDDKNKFKINIYFGRVLGIFAYIW